MAVVIDIPKGVEEQLEAAFGHDLARAARESLAIEGYRTEKLSLGQVAELLGLSTAEVDQFLKDRNVPLLYSFEDFERDRDVIRNAAAQ